ncbi:MAG: transposase [Lewinellaceae bacterium]|nr:transposase [Lewinellaceae bacterium]
MQDGLHRTLTEFLVPVQALSAMFRGKFVSALRRYYKADRLRLDGLCGHLRNKQAFGKLLNALMAEDWVVYAKLPFAGPEQLLAYLGRYTHRVATCPPGKPWRPGRQVGNHRIVSVDKDTVCFRWRDYADGNKQKVMRMEHEEFIRRFLQHILPARFCKIRYYGILSNRLRRQALALCRRALGMTPPTQLPVLSWRERYRQATGIDWEVCPVCGKGRMVTVIWIPAGRRLVALWPNRWTPNWLRLRHLPARPEAIFLCPYAANWLEKE